ncbi:MAG: hypothetical protein PHX83_04205 [Acidobacteriia bacterium]|nr:hypothetical protein [Terriglobia bacterium]
MNRIWSFMVFMLLAFTPTALLPQAGASSKTAQGLAGPPETLSQEDSFRLITSLNEAEKLFPESYIFPFTKMKHVSAETCFGVRLANGARLVGESSGKTYGFHGSFTKADGTKGSFTLIGILHSEFPFSIQDKQFPAGPYILHAYEDALELTGNDESEKHFDYNRRKNVPKARDEKFDLKTRISNTLLSKEAKEIPRFSLAVKNDEIWLELNGNTWKVVPHP